MLNVVVDDIVHKCANHLDRDLYEFTLKFAMFQKNIYNILSAISTKAKKRKEKKNSCESACDYAVVICYINDAYRIAQIKYYE